MGEWGNEEIFSDYTLLYASFHEWRRELVMFTV